jgi:hypothetical protein
MPFYIKYSLNGNTVVEKLQGCKNRGEAVKQLDDYKGKADDHNVSLTSDTSRIEQWQRLAKLESEITPSIRSERE